MSYEFKKLSEVEALTEVPEGATVLAEVDGAIKRIPGNGLGGGEVFAIDFTDMNNFPQSATFNMPPEEAMKAIENRTLGGIVGYFHFGGNTINVGYATEVAIYNQGASDMYISTSFLGGDFWVFIDANGIRIPDES